MVRGSLSNSCILLKGHVPHDLEFKRLCLEDASATVAILWPSADALSPAEVLALSRSRSASAGRTKRLRTDGTGSHVHEDSHTSASGRHAAPMHGSAAGAAAQRNEQGNLILVAVDANWPCARRMMKWYSDVLGDRFVRMALPSDDVFVPGQEESLLAPVRKYRPQDGSFEHRCANAATGTATDPYTTGTVRRRACSRHHSTLPAATVHAEINCNA